MLTGLSMKRADTAKKQVLAIVTAGIFSLTHGPARVAFAQPPPQPSSQPSGEPAPSTPPTSPSTPPSGSTPAPGGETPPAETPPATTPPPATPEPAPAAATYGEADVKEVLAALKAGQPLTPLATAKGTDLQGLIKGVMAFVKTQIPTAVQGGQITQEQADQRVAALQKQLDDQAAKEGSGAAPAAPATPGAAGEKKKEPTPTPAPVRRFTTPVIVTGIIATVSLATGVFFGIDAITKYNAYTKEPDHELGVKGERAAFISDLSFGMAGLFGVTAFVLYMLPDETPTETTKSARPTKRTAPKWSAAPTASPKGAGVSAVFRF